MSRMINGVEQKSIGYGNIVTGEEDLSELLCLLEEADEFDDLWDCDQAREEVMSYYTKAPRYFGMTIKTIEELEAEEQDNYKGIIIPVERIR